jgi:hypothetical protein
MPLSWPRPRDAATSCTHRRIESLREVVFISHDQHRVDGVRREADGSWSTRRSGGGESLTLESVGCAISVDVVYRDPFAGR